MTKKWTEGDIEFAMDSAWTAFESTLKTHGVTEGQVKDLTSIGVAMGLYKVMRNIVYTVTEVGEE